MGPPRQTSTHSKCKRCTQRTAPLRKHTFTGTRAKVSVNAAKAFLYKAAGEDRTCVDVFGWATDFLFPVRNTPFRTQLARLTAKIANADVQDGFGTILTCGSLLALHKESPAKQAERLANNEKHKLRPVNIGSSLLKWAFKCALRTKPARKAAKALGEIQLGLGAPRGVERLAHLFNAVAQTLRTPCLRLRQWLQRATTPGHAGRGQQTLPCPHPAF